MARKQRNMTFERNVSKFWKFQGETFNYNVFFDASNCKFWGSKPTSKVEKFHKHAEGMSLWQVEEIH